MIRHLQRDYFDCLFAGTTDGCGFASCNFSKVADAYGIPSKRMWCDEVKETAPEFLEKEGKLCGKILQSLKGKSGEHIEKRRGEILERQELVRLAKEQMR